MDDLSAVEAHRRGAAAAARHQDAGADHGIRGCTRAAAHPLRPLQDRATTRASIRPRQRAARRAHQPARPAPHEYHAPARVGRGAQRDPRLARARGHLHDQHLRRSEFARERGCDARLRSVTRHRHHQGPMARRRDAASMARVAVAALSGRSARQRAPPQAGGRARPHDVSGQSAAIRAFESSRLASSLGSRSLLRIRSLPLAQRRTCSRWKNHRRLSLTCSRHDQEARARP
jgi:hypothetical protein